MNENNALEGFITYSKKGILNLFGLMREAFHYPNKKERVPFFIKSQDRETLYIIIFLYNV